MVVWESGQTYLQVGLDQGLFGLIVVIPLWRLVVGYSVLGGLSYWRYRRWKNKNKKQSR